MDIRIVVLVRKKDTDKLNYVGSKYCLDRDEKHPVDIYYWACWETRIDQSCYRIKGK